MTATIKQAKTSVATGGTVEVELSTDSTATQFVYLFEVISGGAGGTITSYGSDVNRATYKAPSSFDALKISDTIKGTIKFHDSPDETATASVLIEHPIQLFMDIFKTVIGLDDDHCVLWDQKVFIPKNDGLYIVGIVSDNKIIGNNVIPDKTHGWSAAKQYVQVCASIDVNIISRDTSALFSKEAVVMALMSEYATKQQENCGIKISTVPGSLRDVSTGDGAAIPYRFVMPCKLFYQIKKSVTPEYYDTFQDVAVTTNA